MTNRVLVDLDDGVARITLRKGKIVPAKSLNSGEMTYPFIKADPDGELIPESLELFLPGFEGQPAQSVNLGFVGLQRLTQALAELKGEQEKLDLTQCLHVLEFSFLSRKAADEVAKLLATTKDEELANVDVLRIRIAQAIETVLRSGLKLK